MLLFGAGHASYLALKHYIWRWIENPVPLVGAGERLGIPYPGIPVYSITPLPPLLLGILQRSSIIHDPRDAPVFRYNAT